MTEHEDGYTPTLAELILMGARSVARATWSMLPVEVVEFNEGTGAVSLRPLVNDLDRDGNSIEIQTLPACGVLWAGGGGSYSQVRQIEEGERGLALFSSRAISQWLVSGAARAVPEARRNGSLNDAFYLAGIAPFNDPPASLEGIENGGFRLGLDDGSARIEIRPEGTVVIEGGSVLLGNLATAFAARADLVDAELVSIANALSTISAAIPVANPYAAPSGSVAASKTRIE